MIQITHREAKARWVRLSRAITSSKGSLNNYIPALNIISDYIKQQEEKDNSFDK